MDFTSPASIKRAVKEVRASITTRSEMQTVSERQTLTLKDPGAKGPMWVSRVSFRDPHEDDARQILLKVIERLGDTGQTYTVPEQVAVAAEWTGYRPGVGPEAKELLISEAEKYDALMRETSNPLTILYIHGGAFYLNSPATSRQTVAKLAQLTKGRCLSVRYRLAPQHPFPAALLDVFIAYLSLLSPPPGSYHSAVSPSSIIIAGDSIGSSIGLSLLQVLLKAHRLHPRSTSTIRFHGRNVPLALPAGLTAISAALDQTLSLPSWTTNAITDIFPSETPILKPDFQADDIWPSSPPRGHIYCDSSMLYHPLVSPSATTDWTGAPPMWFACGQEQFVDSAKIVAQTAAKQGVCVWWEEYEAMPHLFPLLFARSPQAKMCFRNWGEACEAFVSGGRLESKGVFWEVKGLRGREVDVRGLIGFDVEEARRRMKEKSCEFKVWTGRKLLNSSL